MSGRLAIRPDGELARMSQAECQRVEKSMKRNVCHLMVTDMLPLADRQLASRPDGRYGVAL